MAIENEEVDVRSGTAAEWSASALVLGSGELGVVKDTGEIKVGNGTDEFDDLPKNPRRGSAVLVAGTVTVSDDSVTANSIIQLTHQNLGTVTAPKAIGVTARVAGTSFTITSADNTDTSKIGYTIYEP